VSTEELRQEIDRVVGECAGAVSLCWEPRPDGVFDSTQAVTYVRGASARLMSVLEAEVASREPIIRADEQKRSAVGIEDEITLDVRRAERERLRAQVKALPLIDYDKDDDELIRRADVLAALGDAP